MPMPKGCSERILPIERTLTVSRITGRLIDLVADSGAEPVLGATRTALSDLRVGDRVRIALHEHENGEDAMVMSGIPGEDRCLIAMLMKAAG